MSTLKGTTMHPRCRHIGACWDLLEWFQLFSTSQNTSRIQFRTFLKKKNQIFWFPCCSTREDLSRWCINYLCRTDIDEARAFGMHFFFSAYGNTGYGHNFVNFELFEKEFIFLGFHGVVLVKTFPLMYQLLM